MTIRELRQLGYRIKDGKAVRVDPTEARKSSEKIDGVYDSKLEADYARHLSYLVATGDVLSFQHHAIIVQYTQKNRYTPDFKVVYADGNVEVVEVKGHRREDDGIKCNAAATILYPWKVVMVMRRKGQWIRKEF